jgi:hypothetical protein
MDAKAAFLSALNGGLLVFLWGSTKLADWTGWAQRFGFVGTMFSLLALTCSLWVISPRGTLSTIVGKATRWTTKYKPVSFYGYVAKNYGQNEFERLESDLAQMDSADFAREALEQHFAISRIIQLKSDWVLRAAFLTVLAILFAGVGLLVKASSS